MARKVNNDPAELVALFRAVSEVKVLSITANIKKVGEETNDIIVYYENLVIESREVNRTGRPEKFSTFYNAFKYQLR